MALLRRLASFPPRWASTGAAPLSALAALLGASRPSSLPPAGGVPASRHGRPAAGGRVAAALSTAPPLPTVAWVGLGAMGVPMAARLAAAGIRLRVYDTSAAAVGAFVDTLPPLSAAAGGRVTPVGSLDELFPHPPSADPPPPPPPAGDGAGAHQPVTPAPPTVALITMLPSTAAVAATLHALAPRAPAGAVLIDMSTIPPDESCALAARVAAVTGADASGRRVHVLDAPVSGGTAAAAAGTLTIIVGGEAATFKAVTPLLSIMGRPVHVGAAGAGQVVKAANNLVLGASMAAVAEATTLAAAAGVPPATTAGVFATSSGRCWASDVYNPAPGVVAGAPAGRGYTGGFRVELMRKDLGIARGMGSARGGKTPTPMADAAAGVYQAMSESGGEGKDFSGIFHYVYQGTRLHKPPGAAGA